MGAGRWAEANGGGRGRVPGAPGAGAGIPVRSVAFPPGQRAE